MSQEEITRLEEQVKTLFNIVGELKDDVKCIRKDLASRLPAWATGIIGLLMGLCGWLAGR